MRHTTFGDPRPRGHAEIMEAIEERDVDVSAVNAELTFDDSDNAGDFKGWTAEVRDNQSGDEQFSTLGYENKAELIADLKAAGITDIQEG